MSDHGSVTLEAWRSAGETFDSDGGPLFTRVAGAGPTLLFIHGFPTASFDWAKIWPALTPHFRCIALDMLGFGFSAKPRANVYATVQQADRIEALLRALGVVTYSCIAHDYGDTVAQELLARQGQGAPHLTRLVLLNGGLFPETHAPVLMQRLLAGPLGWLVARLTTRARFSASLQRVCNDSLEPSELEAMWTMVTHDRGRQLLPVLIGYMAERRTHRARWVGALQRGGVPVRLIDGMDDPISGARMVARYRELIAEPDVIELAGVGHYPQLEAPDRVVRAALPFLCAGP